MTTKKIRVGHGIVICVPEFNHPIKIAERTAVLDILSGGRPHVGVLVAPAWSADPLRPLNPIAASVTSCDTDLPRIRFVMDPEVPVVRGTRRIRESREE